MGLQLLDKKGLNELGKKGLVYKQVVGKASYVSGFPEVDSKIDVSSVFNLPILVNFRKRSEGLEISIMPKFKPYHTGIKMDKIKSIHLEDRDQVYDQKDKSVVGRAVVGGLILGPVGAIVGGMTGVGKKEVALPTPDLFLSIKYEDDNGEEKIFMCTCKHKDRAEIYSFFAKEYPALFEFN